MKKILIINNTRLGDVILTTGVIKAFTDKYPNARLTIASSEIAAPVISNIPNLEKIIYVRKLKYDLHWLKLWMSCVSTKWDIIIDFKHSYISRFLWAKDRYYKMGNKHEHVVIKSSNTAMLDKAAEPYIWRTPPYTQEATKLLKSAKKHPIIALAPTSNWAPKTWPIEHFIVLTDMFNSMPEFKNAFFLIAAAPHEREKCGPLIEHLKGRCIELIDDTHLLTVAECFRKANLFIGNDSGLMHLAAAVGTATVGLFGPTNSALYAPFGKKTLAILAPDAQKISSLTPEEVCKKIALRGLFHASVYSRFAKANSSRIHK